MIGISGHASVDQIMACRVATFDPYSGSVNNLSYRECVNSKILVDQIMACKVATLDPYSGGVDNLAFNDCVKSQANIVPTNVVSGEKIDNDDIIQAITDSLIVKDLNCVDSVSGEKFKASTLNWDGFSGFGLELKTNEHEIPVIVLKITDTMTIELTSNSDLKVVEQIEAIRYNRSTTTSTRKNVGTIINPKYETVIVNTKGTLAEQIICK
jgi:hypothetical protein